MYDDVAKNTSAVGIDVTLCIRQEHQVQGRADHLLKFVADDEERKSTATA
jgi:hypothetical protein